MSDDSRPGFLERAMFAFWDPLMELAQSGVRHPRRAGRIATVAVVEALAFALVVRVIPGFTVDGVAPVIVATLVIAVFNALLRPVVLSLTLALTVLSFGLFSLLLNAATIAIATRIVPGFTPAGVGASLAAAVVLGTVEFVLASLVHLTDDNSFFGGVARRAARRRGRPPTQAAGGLLVISIDGLGEDVARFALRTGAMPTLARWVRSGSHRFAGWECDLPAQTSSSQSGLLYGDNFDIPAFRWYEKEHARWMVSNRAADASEIARRRRPGTGLLAGGGACVGAILTGDAPQYALTMSALQTRAGVRSDDFYSYFLNPNTFTRSLLLSLREIVRELWAARRQRIRDVYPRVHRGLAFAFARAAVNVMMADLTTSMVIDHMYAGAPIIFANYLGYDEVAHHAGPERPEALHELTHVDDTLATLERLAARTPRAYRIVVLSDHGQSQGATFRQRFGVTLEQHIQALVGAEHRLLRSIGTTEEWSSVNALATEALSAVNPRLRRAVSRVLTDWMQEGVAQFGAERGLERGRPEDDAGIVVCASGNLGLIYVGTGEGRSTLETIEARYPLLVAGLAAHPGVGFVLVRSAAHGAVALGANGAHYLADDRIEGTDPLAPFGPRAAAKLRTLDSFPHTGDIVVNSLYDATTDEVAAFEELVGSHGGLGGPQTRAFVLFPSDFDAPAAPFVGAASVHEALRGWRDAALSTVPAEPVATTLAPDAAVTV